MLRSLPVDVVLAVMRTGPIVGVDKVAGLTERVQKVPSA